MILDIRVEQMLANCALRTRSNYAYFRWNQDKL